MDKVIVLVSMSKKLLRQRVKCYLRKRYKLIRWTEKPRWFFFVTYRAELVFTWPTLNMTIGPVTER